MICAWKGLLDIVPLWMRDEVDRLGKNRLQELRLRRDAPPELRLGDGSVYLKRKVAVADMLFCVNAATRYSPWIGESAAKGYITAPGGHRIGICGNAAGGAGSVLSSCGITSLCIRVARDFPGIADGVPLDKSVLIIGKPGSGKTTLLRDVIRQRSNSGKQYISVIDEREEIFPRSGGNFCFSVGDNTDVLSGCNKAAGVDAALRTMSPETIAIDEITAAEDCRTLLQAGWCGVSILATAHAGCKEDLLQRPVYLPIIESKLFDTLLVLREDKSWFLERLTA